MCRSSTRADDEARQEHELYRTLFQSTQEALYVLQDGRFVRCNPAALKVHGCATEAELIGKTPADLSPPRQPDGRDSAEKAQEKLAAAGQPQVFLWRHRRPDGTEFDLELSLNRLNVGGQSLVLASGREVTARLRAEEALKETQRTLSTLLNNLPGMAHRCRNDADWTMEFVSQGCRALTGYEPGDLVANATISYGELIHPQDREMVWVTIQAALAAKELFRLVYRIRPRSGEEKWVWEQGCGVIGENGEVAALEGFISDITERRRAEEALVRERDFNKTVIQASPALFVAIQPDGRTLAMNDTMLRLLGYTAEEVLGKDYLTTFVPSRERAAVSETFRALVQSKETVTQTENHIVSKDGREHLIEWHGAQIYRGDQLDYFFGVGVDITARRRTEEALRTSEERYSLTLGALNDGLWDWDVPSGTTYFSPRYYTMLGYEPGEFPATYAAWRAMVHTDDLPRVEDEIRKNHEQRSDHYMGEFRMRTKSGRWIWILSRGKVVKRGASGKPVRMVGTHHDISDRKQAETERERLMAEAQAANSAKDRFLAVLSHELRNPLAAIQAGVELLRLTSAPGEPRAGRALEVIARNANLQARLVNDLLDLSRVTQGRLALRRVPVEVSAVVRSAVQACRADAASAKVAVEVREASPLWVDGDIDRLQQVVMNLLSNAVKFTPPGGRATVSVTSAGEQVRVAVEDTGIGIDPARLATLFRVFEQGPVGSQRAPGLGIGLALVKSLTEMHGGRVWAESPGPGRGSRFTVELPLTQAPAVRPPQPRAGHEQRPIRALLVEDNADTRTILVEALALMGYRVIAAESGEGALEILLHETVDVLVADIGLPGMDGYEFLRRARRLPSLARCPAFAVTGYGQPKDVQRAREAGYDGHFVKPVDLRAFDQRIRETLGVSPDAEGL